MSDLVYEVPEKQRYWVVRAKNGLYIPHFKKHGIVAIEHFDDELRGKINALQLFDKWSDRLNELAVRLAKTKEKRGKLLSFTSQIEDFAIEINVGDLIIVPSYGRLLYGRVTSGVFADDSPLYADEIFDDDGKPVLLNAKLRRNVNWGPEVQRGLANTALRYALGSHRTVFCADNYWREIHHVVYPFFKRGDDIYFSLKIKRQAAIRNTAVAKIFAVLSNIEALSRADVDSQIAIDTLDIDALTEQLDDDGQLTLQVKSYFMSPGEIWGAAAAVGGDFLTYYLIYSAVFGSSKLGWKGFFDPRKIPPAASKFAIAAVEKLTESIKRRKIEGAIQELQIEENRAETKPLEAKNDDVTDVIAKPKRITGKKKKDPDAALAKAPRKTRASSAS